MSRVTLHQLGDRLRRQRGDQGIRAIAREIGVSPATLSRVERGNLPDLETFAKICRWMRLDPAEVLGVEYPKNESMESSQGAITATAHFKTGQTTSPELANALAEMILAAQRMMGRRSS